MAAPETRATVNNVYYEISVRVNSFVNNVIVPNMTSIMTAVSRQTMNVISGFFNLVVGFIVAIYVLNSKEKFCGQAKKMAYSFLKERYANEIISAFRYSHQTFTGFISGKIVDSVIIGILSYIGNLIMSIPYPVLIAVIVGITNIIPFFGPYIGGIAGFLLLILIDPLSAFVFLVFVIILQQFDGNILGPKILGNSTGLSSFWVIFSIMFFGSMWGFAGWILGVPIFAVIYAFIRHITNAGLTKRRLPVDELEYVKTAYIENGQFHYLGEADSTKYNSQKPVSSWKRIFKGHRKQL
jgi:predicted PurR-regulated permease PerM